MEKPRVWPMFAAFLAVLATLGFLAMVALLVFDARSGRTAASIPLDANTLFQSVLATSFALLVTTAIFALPRTRARVGLVALAGGPLTWGAAIVGMLALGEALDATVTLLGLFDVGALGIFRRALVSAGPRALLPALLCFALLPGVAEELFFRGLLQTRFSERWGPRVGIAVTSGLFGLMHFDPIHSTLAFAMGLWLGFVRYRTGSVLPAVAAHVVNNLVATLAASAGLVPDSTRSMVVLAVVSAAALVPCYLRLRRLPLPAHAPAVTTDPDQVALLR